LLLFIGVALIAMRPHVGPKLKKGGYSARASSLVSQSAGTTAKSLARNAAIRAGGEGFDTREILVDGVVGKSEHP
jgi:hypothetical protein